MAQNQTCFMRLMRYILLLLNSIFFLIGLTLLGLGIYVKVDDDFSSVLDELAKISTFEAQSFGYLAFVLIGGGIFTVLISLTGFLGSLWYNRCLLYSYVIFLGILMIFELAGFVLAFVYRNKLEKVYRENLKNVFTDALINNKIPVLNAFHDLEKKVQCCGVNGVNDYNPWQQPPNWCFTHTKGCADVIINALEQNLPVIYIVLGTVLLLELLSCISSIALARAVRNAVNHNDLSIENETIPINPQNRRRNYVKITHE